MAAVVASMAFVFMSSGGIKTVLGQGTNKTSMSSMNMTGTAGSNSGNMPGMGGMSRIAWAAVEICQVWVE